MKSQRAKARKSTQSNAKAALSSGRKKSANGQKGNQAGRPTQAELARRKAKIMQVATSLFVRDGYAATSLVDIAKGAGVATRTLYQHFGDKEAIFHDVMFARETAAVYEPPTVHDGDTLFDALMRAAQYVCDVSLRPSTVDLMRLAIAESKRFPDLTKSLTDATYTRFRANIRNIFDELDTYDLIDDDDTAEAANIFIDLLLGTLPVLLYAGWRQSPPSDMHLGRKVDLFVLGRYGPKVANKSHQLRAKLTARAREA